MSFPRYAEYRDSGVEWLGEVPAQWAIKPLKALSTCNDDVLDESTKPEQEIRYIEISGVDASAGILESSVTTFESAPSRARRKVKHGDVLVSTVRTYLRAISPVANPPDNMVVSTGFAVVRPRQIEGRFLGYLLRAEFYIAEVIARSVGVSYPAINASDLMRIAVPVPSVPEQTAIAAFLDRETAKIDALVAEQEKLIALLKEKRQAVISHAVTKGLNPAAPMKDSGIEWLGQVPAHWEIMPLKRDLAFITSGSRGWAEHYSDEGELFIRIGNLTRETLELDLSEIQRVSVPAGSEGERTVVRPGDLLFSITAYLGSVAVASEATGKAYVSQHVALARLVGAKLLARWVGYVVLSVVGKTYLDQQAYGGTKIQLGLDEVANMICVVPPVNEQGAIVIALDKATREVDLLIAAAESAIKLLKERRSALISAAVTGQIDLRGVVQAA